MVVILLRAIHKANSLRLNFLNRLGKGNGVIIARLGPISATYLQTKLSHISHLLGQQGGAIYVCVMKRERKLTDPHMLFL